MFHQRRREILADLWPPDKACQGSRWTRENGESLGNHLPQFANKLSLENVRVLCDRLMPRFLQLAIVLPDSIQSGGQIGWHHRFFRADSKRQKQVDRRCPPNTAYAWRSPASPR